MCGIVGYKGKRNVKEVLLNGLETLEYRGYDSAGMAVLDNNKIRIVKSVGKIENLRDKVKRYDFDKATCGIAHTRWATHGKVCEENSHPHKVGRVVLVHNGIIENYKEIEELVKKYEFKSETDTERVCALIDSYYNGDNELEAIEKAIEHVKGSYALGIMFEGKDMLYGVKKDAPLVLGVGKNEYFLSSDISAFLAYTKEHIFLEDNEIVEIGDGFEVYFNGIIIPKKTETATYDIESAQKGGYEHFMLKEIDEQEEVAKKLYAKYIVDDSEFSDSVVDLSKYKRIDFVACGSAYHAALIGKYFIDKYATTRDFYCNVYNASEYRYTNHYFDKDVLVVVLSQSGETADTLASLRMCKGEGVDTLAIVNVISSTIAREADMVMPMLAGPEICVATTKGYFSQSYICSLLVLKLMYRNRIIDKKELTRIFEDFKKLPKYISSVISKDDYIKVAKSIYKEQDMYYIGRGIDIYSCYEASLKLKEISYIHSECFAAGELKHGPIALLSKNTPVIALLTEFSVSDKTISNIIEAKSRGAKIITIRKESINIDKGVSDFDIVVPLTSEFCQNLVIMVACQLLAYNVAKLNKCDIDKPRNLAKSVTVE